MNLSLPVPSLPPGDPGISARHWKSCATARATPVFAVHDKQPFELLSARAPKSQPSEMTTKTPDIIVIFQQELGLFKTISHLLLQAR